MTDRPNVLLLLLDTARADAFEPYGAPAGSSPTVAQLADRGVAVSSAFAPASWTVPSHGAMFTGLLPRTSLIGRGEHGTPQGISQAIDQARDRLLPAVLGAAGYATAGVSTNAWVSPQCGFDTGFERFEMLDGDRLPAMNGTGAVDRVRWMWQSLRARTDDGAAAVERLISTWVQERDDRPFFWFVNLVECHSPYLPPRPFNDLGPIERIKAGEDARRHLTFAAFTRTCLGDFDVEPAALERMRHLYGRSISLLDGWLARVMTALERAGLLDDTIVLVTSDHGENFGECGLMGHAFSLDDRLIRVPLVVAGPWSPPPDRLVSLVDLPRLLADAVGLDDHPWRDRTGEDVAVAQLDAPCAPDDPVAVEALDSLGLGLDALPRLVRSFTCATDGRLKLFRDGSSETIVDLEADPMEEEPEMVGRVHELRHGPALQRLRTALDEAAAVERNAGPGQLNMTIDDPELEKKMRLLGYL